MSRQPVDVFFYGLFMDRSVLGSKSITPSSATTGYVDGYRLRIGRRATLVPESGRRAHGVLMTLDRSDAAALYADETVSDYVAEPVSVVLPGGIVKPAICYNLPPDRLEGANPAYAESLLRLARGLGFPQHYLDQIEGEANRA